MKRLLLFCTILVSLCCHAQVKNSAYPSNFETAFVMVGKSVRISVPITNTGSNVIQTLSYVLTIDGVESAPKTVTVGSIAPQATGQATFTYKAETEAKRSNCTFTITKVNGSANTSEQTSSTGSVVVILEKPIVVPVVEEFTGTWCGWCPVGFDGMEKAHETFGEKVALIAVHYGDVMQAEEFQNLVGRVSGFPSAIIDREAGDFYPAASELRKKINSDIQNKIAAGSIEVNASWTSSAKTTIKIDTKTKFVYSDDNANYAIGYALTEDGMKGTGSDWAQNNNLSGNTNYSSIPFWYKAPSKVTGIEFNHVGVAAWGLEDGIKGSVDPVIVAGEEQEYTYNANISGKKLIQDKSKLNVIALLIDRNNGKVVNAAQCSVVDHNATAINGVSAFSEGEGAIYNISGQRVNKVQKGLYIVNGKKVFVK